MTREQELRRDARDTEHHIKTLEQQLGAVCSALESVLLVSGANYQPQEAASLRAQRHHLESSIACERERLGLLMRSLPDEAAVAAARTRIGQLKVAYREASEQARNAWGEFLQALLLAEQQAFVLLEARQKGRDTDAQMVDLGIYVGDHETRKPRVPLPSEDEAGQALGLSKMFELIARGDVSLDRFGDRRAGVR